MDLGLEAINFRHGESDLAKGLTSIFQDMINYANSLDVETVTEKKKKVVAKFKSDATPRFKELIKNETNLLVDKIHYSQESISCFFAVRMKLADDEIGGKIMINYTGTSSQSEKFKPTTYAELVKIADSLDKETGKFKRENVKDDKYRVACDLYIDPIAATMVQDVLHQKFTPLTAPELAAIELHEIGHMLTLIEHTADMYHTKEALTSASEYFVKYGTMDEKMKMVSDIKKTSEKDKKLKKIVPVLDRLEEYYAYIKENESSGGKVLSTMVALLGVICNFVLMSVICNFRSHVLLAEYIVRGVPKMLNFGSKTSDFRVTSENFKYIEKLADEYVTRHGYGSHLIGGLNKIVSFMEFGGFIFGENKSQSVRSNTIMFYLQQSPMLVYKLTGWGWDSDPLELYEDEFDRIFRVKQNTIAFFKQHNVDPETRKYYIDEMTKIEKEIMKKRKSTKGKVLYASKVFWGFMDRRFSLKAVLTTIVDGRFDTEYKILMNQVKNLVNNTLYHKSAILEDHATKIK